MAKEKAAVPAGGFMTELFQFGLYKRNQGRITRQVTFAAIAVTVGLGAWRLFETQLTETWLNWIAALPKASGMFFFPVVLLVIGVWFAYRLVNLHNFADFLIAVEAEMNKVSWPSRGELFRSSAVVIFVIILLALCLFSFDVIWQFLFTYFLQILPKAQ